MRKGTSARGLFPFLLGTQKNTSGYSVKTIWTVWILLLLSHGVKAATLVLPVSADEITFEQVSDYFTSTLTERYSISPAGQNLWTSAGKTNGVTSVTIYQTRAFSSFDLNATSLLEGAVLSFDATSRIGNAVAPPYSVGLGVGFFVRDGALSNQDFDRQITSVFGAAVVWDPLNKPLYTHYEVDVSDLLREAQASGLKYATFRFQTGYSPLGNTVEVANVRLVPEPAAGSLLSFGVAMVFLRRRCSTLAKSD